MILEMLISLVWIDQNRFTFFFSELLKPSHHKNATSLKMERSDVEHNSHAKRWWHTMAMIAKLL